MQIAYYYRKCLLNIPEGLSRHEGAGNLLGQLRTVGRITDYTINDCDIVFRTDEARQELFNQLRDFALRHHVGLARSFGSRNHGFSYLPEQFLLIREGDQLQEVFPCRIGDGDDIEPLEYLERLAGGQPWTTRSARGAEGRRHKALVAEILSNPDTLEPRLVVRGQNVQVSRDFGELGFVDLVFEDCEGRFLLVEVKVGPNELDKAIGQIKRHRYLFARQNRMEETTVRIGIVCPFIPADYRSICAREGITCFEVPKTPAAETLGE